MPTFTSTREIFRLEGVTLAELAGGTLPSGAQLTTVSLVAIDQLNPNSSQILQESDADRLSSGRFTNFQGQGPRQSPAEAATIIIDGQVVANQVPTLFSVDFFENGTNLNVSTNGGTLFSPRIFEVDDVVYIVPREPAEQLAGIIDAVAGCCCFFNVQ
ncbi:MAG: hypothetical protein AAGA08_06345 [Pseudomonadota bacterium]